MKVIVEFLVAMSSIEVRYSPKHAQPATLEQLCELDEDTLAAEIPRLENSIKHLRRSNQEILEFTQKGSGDGAVTEDEEDDEEFQTIVKENEEVISSQTERIHMIHLALQAKFGFDPTNPHYRTVDPTNPPPSLLLSDASSMSNSRPPPRDAAADDSDYQGVASSSSYSRGRGSGTTVPTAVQAPPEGRGLEPDGAPGGANGGTLLLEDEEEGLLL